MASLFPGSLRLVLKRGFEKQGPKLVIHFDDTAPFSLATYLASYSSELGDILVSQTSPDPVHPCPEHMPASKNTICMQYCPSSLYGLAFARLGV